LEKGQFSIRILNTDGADQSLVGPPLQADNLNMNAFKLTCDAHRLEKIGVRKIQVIWSAAGVWQQGSPAHGHAIVVYATRLLERSKVDK
jgi:hypothetical protein